ncbi:CPBP family intramembrane glutamic endopeptidase [Leucobacter sp. Ag1]|uniref:CPBP family intramembrane glutamic endopeptidase n=1 Tax=unclassified Leucobacter TaxID=2621730 RepID=UPI00350E59E4
MPPSTNSEVAKADYRTLAIRATTASPLIAPLAVAGAYIGRGVSVAIVIGSLALLFVLAGVSHLSGRPQQGGILLSLAGVLSPLVFGWDAAVPLLGAVVLSIFCFRNLKNLVSLRPFWTLSAALTTGIIILGVAAFQIGSNHLSPKGASLEWSSLPGQEHGTVFVLGLVISVSAVNSIFEELLWRTALLKLFRPRPWAWGQWLVVSACFGLSHLFGTPGGLAGVAWSMTFGLAMCVLRQISNGSISWIILAHFSADFILIGALYGIFN